MRLKLKRMVALLLAVCVMASTAAPVFAADEPLLEQPPVTAEEVAGELTLPGEVPAATETPKATEVPAATEEPVVTEMPAATEAPEMTEVPEATEEPVATEVPAATEAPEATETPAPTETPEANEVPVAEDGADKLAQAKKAAPQIPGFELYTGDSIDTARQYILVAQDQREGENGVYALYLSADGASTSPGALKAKGAVTAQLNLSENGVTAAWLKNGESLTLDQLLLDAKQSEDGKVAFSNSATGQWLKLDGSMTAATESFCSVQKKADGSYLLKNAANNRVLSFNINGDGGKFTSAQTDFWGPQAETDYSIYLYARQSDENAPQIPGFSLYTSSQLDLSKEYLIVARGKEEAYKDEVYALYLSDAGKSLNPGSLSGVDGTVTAKLTLTEGGVQASWLKDGSTLTLEDLTLVGSAMDGGFSLQNAKSGNYLALAESNMVADQAVSLGVAKAGDGWQISGAKRVLDFNRKGDTTQYPNNITDFWGPRSLSEGKSYTLWLYARDITLNETDLKIDGYTQAETDILTDGVYAVVGYDEGFRVLSASGANNANAAVRDDRTGKLTNAQEALAGADLSLTSTQGGVYLTAMTEDGPVYLGLGSEGVFRSDAPVLLTVTKNENNTYTLSAGEARLAVENGGFTANAQGSLVQLFLKKAEQPTLVRTKAMVEQGYAGTSQLAVTGGTEWIYTDARGAQPATLEWTLTENPDGAFRLENGVLTALKASGTGTASGKLVYTEEKAVDLGTVALTACGPEEAITGTTQNQPFVNGEPDGGNGKNYRIPSLITLDNGWMVAAADMRWQTTADSPQNLDTIVSVSKDGGATWSYEVVNYFDDQANSATGQASASFIDPSMVQGPDGKLYMVVDACPSYVGLMSGNRMGNQSSGFDEQGRMLVALAGENQDAPKEKSAYTYRVDLNAEPARVTVEGQELKLYPITTESGETTGQWVNAELDLFAWDGASGPVEKVMREQLSSGEMVQTNLFYRSSAWKAYPVFYIMLRSAEVTADGLVWGEPTFLDIKYTENESFTGVCPGRGLVTTVEGKQRIVFPLYDNATGQEYASVIYSDDNGKTWTRGDRVNNLASGSKTSESQVVNLPDGGMRIFCRNLGGQITFADSYDGGATWGQATADSALNYTSNCMVSFINAAGYVKSPEGKVYGDLVIASYPAGGGRTDGVIRVGSMSDTGTITWLNDTEVDFAGRYQYSCLTQKQGDALGLLFESGTAGPGSTENSGAGGIYYTDLTITGMLGEGWSYLASYDGPVEGGHSGVTQDQPYIPDETGSSRRFRIPAMITLDNGWILSAADARWGSTMDAANNLDGLVSLSKDGGKTWEWQMINHFADFPDQTPGAYRKSASFIDPALIQSEDGTIYMVVDACPAYSGLQNGGTAGKESTGFDENGNLVIARGEAGSIASTKAADYTYYIDSKDPQSKVVEGQNQTLYPIKDAAGALTGAWVDAEYNLYETSGSAVVKSTCRQELSGKTVQNNVFYSQSEWKIYPTFHIWLRTGNVTETGIQWSEPRILNVKQPGEGFVGVCPGRGLTVELGEDGTERVLFQVYDNATGQERASVIYTDDGGATWQRGEHVTNNVGKTSESQTVLLPDGGIRMYSRNDIGYISYADSYDGGVTWGPSCKDEALNYVGNCMVSFINVDGALVDSDGNVYDNLIAASYPKGSGRNNGVLRIGSIDAATNQVTWLNPADVKYPGSYLYSCLTQLEGEALGLLYEKEDTSYGTGYILYDSFAMTDLMGEGWSYLAQAPQLTLNTGDIACDAGSTVQVSAGTAGIPQDARLQWSLTSDGEAAVAALDKTESSAGERVTLTAQAVGKATLTVTAQVQTENKTLTLQDSVRVYVSDENTVTLPDEFENGGVTESAARNENPLLKMQTAIEDGVYAIVAGGKVLYSSATGTAADQVGVTDEAGELNLNTGFDANTQLWKLTKTEQGYTLESMARPGWYLAVEGQTGGKYPPVKETPTYFSITGDGEGGYQISTLLDGTEYFLSQTGKFCITAGSGSEMAMYRQFALQAGESYYRTSATGLKKMIAFLEGLDESLYTPASWDRVQQEKAAAEQAAALDGALFVDSDARSAAARDQARQAQETINEATGSLFQAARGLEKKADVRYTVTFRITGEYFAEESFAALQYKAGEQIDAPAAPAHEGYTFSGWQNLPETMPEKDLVVTGSYTKDAGEPEQPEETPTPTPVPTPVPTPAPDPGQDSGDQESQNGSGGSGSTAAPSATAAPTGTASAQTGDSIWPLAALSGLALSCAAALVLLRRKQG